MQRYDGLVQSTTGAVIPGASVQVNILSSGAAATIYSDEVPNAKTNPMTSGSDGSFFFYAADDDYTIAATYGGTTYTLGDVTLHSPPAWRNLVVKASSVAVNNSIVLKNDEELEFAVLDNETWEFSLHLDVTTNLNADFRFKLTGPGGSGGIQYRWFDDTGLIEDGLLGFEVETVVASAAALTRVQQIMHGHYAATSDGDIHFQWAQGTAHASNTEVRINSYLIARKVLLA